MSWPTPIYIDGSLQTAARCSMPVLSEPIPGVNTPYLLTEDWQQLLVNNTSWVPLALNTAHPEYAGFVLVEESPLQDLGSGQVRWTRTYAKVPAQHNEWEDFSYAFPGSADAILNQSPNPHTRTVRSRLQHDYFLVGTGGTYASADLIPDIQATIFCMVGTVSGTNVGAPWVPVTYVSNGLTIGVNVFQLTTPNFTDYQAMLLDVLSNEWASTVCVQTLAYDSTNHITYIPLSGGGAPVYGGQIVAEKSRTTRWKGNIYLRTSRYVLAI